MLRSAPINGTAAATRKVLRYVWCYAQVPALTHKPRRIEAFVAAPGHVTGSRSLLQHGDRRVTPGGSRGFPDQARHNQAMAILHQQIPAVAQLGLLACAFARQERVGIAFRFVRFVRTLLPTK